jgi:hypothetical protein
MLQRPGRAIDLGLLATSPRLFVKRKGSLTRGMAPLERREAERWRAKGPLRAQEQRAASPDIEVSVRRPWQGWFSYRGHGRYRRSRTTIDALAVKLAARSGLKNAGVSA